LLDEGFEEDANQAVGECREDDPERESQAIMLLPCVLPALTTGGQETSPGIEDDVSERGSIDNDDCSEGACVQDNVEEKGAFVESEEAVRKAEVTGAGDGEELGEALQRGEDEESEPVIQSGSSRCYV